MRDVLEKAFLLCFRLIQLAHHLIHGLRQLPKLLIPVVQLPLLQAPAADVRGKVGELLHRLGEGFGDTAAQKRGNQHCGQDHNQKNDIDLTAERRDGGHIRVNEQTAPIFHRVIQQRECIGSAVQRDDSALCFGGQPMASDIVRQLPGGGLAAAQDSPDGAVFSQHRGAVFRAGLPVRFPVKMLFVFLTVFSAAPVVGYALHDLAQARGDSGTDVAAD